MRSGRLRSLRECQVTHGIEMAVAVEASVADPDGRVAHPRRVMKYQLEQD
jgi:hypothetical protein